MFHLNLTTTPCGSCRSIREFGVGFNAKGALEHEKIETVGDIQTLSQKQVVEVAPELKSGASELHVPCSTSSVTSFWAPGWEGGWTGGDRVYWGRWEWAVRRQSDRGVLGEEGGWGWGDEGKTEPWQAREDLKRSSAWIGWLKVPSVIPVSLHLLDPVHGQFPIAP